MGQSLVYLNEPNKEIEQEKGGNQYMSYATGSMQGWRLNMVSTQFTIVFLLTSTCNLQEDSHLVDLKFMGNENKALFGVFDGHGGREVAIYCGNHYIDILKSQSKLIDEISTAEWLRRSFLDVDKELRADDGKKEIADLRKEKPPKKSPIL